MSKSSGIRALGLALAMAMGLSSCLAPNAPARGELYTDAAPPPSDEALIYIYRPRRHGGTNGAIYAGRQSSVKKIGDLKIGGFFPLYWPRGGVELRAESADVPPVSLYLTAGERYYLRWGISAHDPLVLVDRATGAREIRLCRSDN
jgi:hypothetical protein